MLTEAELKEIEQQTRRALAYWQGGQDLFLVGLACKELPQLVHEVRRLNSFPNATPPALLDSLEVISIALKMMQDETRFEALGKLGLDALAQVRKSLTGSEEARQ